MRRRTVVWWVGLVVLLGACGGGEAPLPTAPVTAVHPPTAAPDPFEVPAVIDEVYVDRVLAALDAAAGDAVRLVFQEKAVTPEAVERLDAIYEGVVLDLRKASLRDDQSVQFKGYPASPGNRRTTVTELISAGPACVFAAVEVDYSAASTEIDELQMQWIALHRREPSGAVNPTPWVVVYDGFQQDFSGPEDPCLSP